MTGWVLTRRWVGVQRKRRQGLDLICHLPLALLKVKLEDGWESSVGVLNGVEFLTLMRDW